MNIILIHGTFAEGALWVKRGSDLFNALEKTFPSARITDFGWNGKNSHRDRLNAGRELAARVRSMIASATDDHFTLIAHSHGGTVALYALRDLEADPRTQGLTEVICLNTPIQVFEPRALTLTEVAVQLLSVVVNVVGTASTLVRTSTGVDPWNPLTLLVPDSGKPLTNSSELGFLLMSSLGVAVFAVLIHWVFVVARAHAKKLAEELSIPTFSRGVLAIRTTGDEVPGYLKSWSLVSNLWPLIPVFAICIALVGAIVLVVAVCAALLYLAFYMLQTATGSDGFHSQAEVNSYFDSVIGALLYLIPTLVFFAALLIIVPVALLFVILMRSTRLSYGDSMLSALLLRVWIAAPATVFGYESDIALKIIGGGYISHSSIYASDLTAKAISAWIKGPRRTPPPPLIVTPASKSTTGESWSGWFGEVLHQLRASVPLTKRKD